MATLAELKELWNLRRNGCVALGHDDKTNNKYYAVNKNSNNKKDFPLIEEIVGPTAVFCKYDESITVLRPDIPDSKQLKLFEKRIYRMLEISPVSICFDMVPPVYSNTVARKAFYPDNRFFTCAEKKIVGHAYLNDVTITKLFTTREPCYHCLPLIESVDYLFEGRKIKHISKVYNTVPSIGLVAFLYKAS